MLGGFIAILVGPSLLSEVAREEKGENIESPKLKIEHKQTYEDYVRERLNVEKMLR